MLGRLPEDQHNAALFGEQVESYLQYGTALRLSYDRKLAGPISGRKAGMDMMVGRRPPRHTPDTA